MPTDKEVFGIVERMLGGSRMLVKCKDNKMRTCRVPGRIKRKIWIKEGDVVLVKPWGVQGEEKGDIVWRYTKPQINRLAGKGVI